MPMMNLYITKDSGTLMAMLIIEMELKKIDLKWRVM